MTDLDELLTAADTEPPAVTAGKADMPAPRRRRWGVVVLSLLAIAALGICGWVLAVILTTGSPPKAVEEFVGTASTEVRKAATTVTGGTPTVTLGGVGGQAQLDVCDGKFIEMDAYRVQADLPPTFSAHNGCGGDTVLMVPVGGVIDVVGRDGVTRTFTVTEERRLNKDTTTTADVAGMTGEHILQTCFWDDATMRFISLAPAAV
ncbi:hypothetical protein [Leucobacter sp. cx-169]|uniref:hypothetical protein n=1 Tax=Leucobacter sp. cx-169 TaxID=2770549 RepID=UPI00165E255B|nr:hypothetical protein [Leucobacter sp. cx-169]MBC9927311.1 hypothetical protein [Leucobacter sp. cx-169]